MFNFDDLKYLFEAKTKCIWINSSEETRVIANIKNIVAKGKLPYGLKTWSCSEGLKQVALLSSIESKEADKRVSIDKLYSMIEENQCEENQARTIYIIKDYHLINDNKIIIRGLRDIKEKPAKEIKNYCPIIVISPITSIPIEHENLFAIIDFKKPNRKDIEKIIGSFCSKMEKVKEEKGYVIPTKDEIESSINLAIGLTTGEINNLLAFSLSKYKTINPNVFYEARLNLINKCGLLELVETNININDMGGNHLFKEWVDDVKISMMPEAKAFGVEKSKGYLSIGIPGTSKTLSAEIMASELNLPLIKFNTAKVMNSYVGKTEQNMEKALSVIKACSPCVLLIDEIEKSLSGMQSSGRVDGGTMARVIGSILQFLSSKDSEDVFTVMTSNDASQMPPELTRSGRLDTIWYFGLPSKEERKEIFRIHFSKTKINIDEDVLDYASSNSDKLTGAEIKEVVKVSIRKAFKRSLKDENEAVTFSDIEEAISEIVPLHVSYIEKIKYLESFAKTRARYASKIIDNDVVKSRKISMKSLSK